MLRTVTSALRGPTTRQSLSAALALTAVTWGMARLRQLCAEALETVQDAHLEAAGLSEVIGQYKCRIQRLESHLHDQLNDRTENDRNEPGPVAKAPCTE